MPEQAGLLLKMFIEQNETVSIIALTQKKDHFRSSIVVIIARIQKLHKGANSSRSTVGRYEIPGARLWIVRIVHISAVSRVEARLNKKRVAIGRVGTRKTQGGVWKIPVMLYNFFVLTSINAGKIVSKLGANFRSYILRQLIEMMPTVRITNVGFGNNDEWAANCAGTSLHLTREIIVRW